MPDRFEPMDIYAAEVLGRWTGESGVDFVRAYELRKTDEVRPAPAWLSGAESIATMEVPPDPDELMRLMREAVRQMEIKQDIHYSSNMTYTTQLDSLSFEQPEGLEVGFVMANARGWSAVFTHPGMDRLCALAFGFVVPPGWTPGSIVCAPEASTTATDANG